VKALKFGPLNKQGIAELADGAADPHDPDWISLAEAVRSIGGSAAGIAHLLGEGPAPVRSMCLAIDATYVRPERLAKLSIVRRSVEVPAWVWAIDGLRNFDADLGVVTTRHDVWGEARENEDPPYVPQLQIRCTGIFVSHADLEASTGLAVARSAARKKNRPPPPNAKAWAYVMLAVLDAERAGDLPRDAPAFAKRQLFFNAIIDRVKWMSKPLADDTVRRAANELWNLLYPNNRVDDEDSQ
jgi:hypothetical protein